MKIFSIMVFSWVFSYQLSFATQISNSVNPSGVSDKNLNFKQASINLVCPEAKNLMKNEQYWQVGDVWKSDEQSENTSITEFIGVQWQGANFGKIICLYKENSQYAFPVALTSIHPLLVYEPTGVLWVNVKHDYKQCISGNVYDCPFVAQAQDEAADPYEQIQYQPKTLTVSPFEE